VLSAELVGHYREVAARPAIQPSMSRTISRTITRTGVTL
jgi:hypothetical protein